MGLDTVELMLKTEEDFGIVIHDYEAEEVATVGQLHALVVRKLRQVVDAPCLTAHAFYRLRRALVDLYDYERAWVHPRRTLFEVIPSRDPVPHWAALSFEANLTLPPLDRVGFWIWGRNAALPGAMTLGQLARETVAWSRLKQGDAEPDVDEEAVYEQLRDNIVEVAWVKPEAVIPEARFVHDLGMD